MRVAIVNMMHTGSTGKIMFGIAKCAREAGHEVITISPEYYVRHGRMEKTPIDSHYYFGFRKENMFTNKDVDYQKGDKVHHDEYGEGIITAVDKKILTIAFSHPIGIRKFLKGHKNITKV